RDREARRDKRPFARLQLDVNGRTEIGAGVARVSVRRQRSRRVEPLDEYIDVGVAPDSCRGRVGRPGGGHSVTSWIWFKPKHGILWCPVHRATGLPRQGFTSNARRATSRKSS